MFKIKTFANDISKIICGLQCENNCLKVITKLISFMNSMELYTIGYENKHTFLINQIFLSVCLLHVAKFNYPNARKNLIITKKTRGIKNEIT